MVSPIANINSMALLRLSTLYDTIVYAMSKYILQSDSGRIFGMQGRLIRRELHLTAENLVVRKPAATPIDLVVVLSLRGYGQRDEPRGLIRSPEPTVGHHGLVVFPFAGKFVMLRHTKD